VRNSHMLVRLRQGWELESSSNVRRTKQRGHSRVSAFALGASVMLCMLAAACASGSTVASFTRSAAPFPSPLTSAAIQLSSDVFTNASSQHATEVEPSAFAFGSVIVAAFQSGRFFEAGSSDIAFATSHDGGISWEHGVLPGTTNVVGSGNPFDSISDPSVAYDSLHGEWLIAALPVVFSGLPAPAAVVSRSSDGFEWSTPVSVATGQLATDKDWITCDDWPGSPYYGHCYLEWDSLEQSGKIFMSTSLDGGATWSAPLATANGASGIGGEPVVQPDGDVVVPIDDFTESNILSFVSNNGGTTWGAASLVSPIFDHFEAGYLRSSPLLSATVDAAGKVYVIWQDCRFRVNCRENDIVLSTSTDGMMWSQPVRVPIDPLTSTADHFIPGIGIAPLTAGSSARLGVTYYFYPQSGCAGATCHLEVGYISSPDGGTTWSNPVFLAGPMSVQWLPQTTIGVMVGDYTATVFSGNQPLGIFAVARSPSGDFNEAMFASKLGAISQMAGIRRSFGERPIPGAHSDHGPRKPLPPESLQILADPFEEK
jgi:BNR repeat-like domain